MGFDWSKENNQNRSVSRSSSPLEPYLSLAHEESLQTQNQTLAHQKGWFGYRAAAGNQANVSAARQRNQTLESIRFPFQGAWGGYYVLWSDVEKNIDAHGGMGGMVRDNAAQHIVKYLKERDELDTVGGDPRGRRILVRLYDELTSGSVWDDERESADSIALVLKKSLDPKAFTRLLDPKAAPVIPISADGFTRGSWVQAKLLPSGKIFIKPSSSGEDWNYKKNYPDFFEWQGAEFDPQDVLNVVLMDVSPISQPILAVEFLAFGNANEYETLKKAIEATVAGATLPFSGAGLGGRVFFESVASNSPKLARALSLTSGVSESSMALARGISSTIEFADAAAIAWGSISFFVHSIEGGLIRRFGDDGKELLAWVHLLDRVTLIYGISRVVAEMGDLINAIYQRSKALLDVARRSTTAGGEDVEFAKVLEVIVDKTDELSVQQRQILELNQQRLAGGAPKGASTEARPLLPDSTISSVRHPAFELPGSYKGGTKARPQSAGEGVPEAWMLDALSKEKVPPKTPPVPQELRVEAPASRTKGQSVPDITNPKMEAASNFGSSRRHSTKNMEPDSYRFGEQEKFPDFAEEGIEGYKSPSDIDVIDIPDQNHIDEVTSDTSAERLTLRKVWQAPHEATPRPSATTSRDVRLRWLRERLRFHVEEAIDKFNTEGLTYNQALDVGDIVESGPEKYARLMEEGILGPDTPARSGDIAREVKAVTREPGSRFSTHRGSRIDEFAKDTIMQDPELVEIITAPDFFNEPDILDSVLTDWFDLTTEKQWRAHMEKYSERYGDLGHFLSTLKKPKK